MAATATAEVVKANVRRQRRRTLVADVAARIVLAVLAFIPAAALVFLAYQLVKSAYPAIVFNGWKFFTTKTFTLGSLYSTGTEVRHGFSAPQGAQFGILPLVFGTVVSSAIALAIAVPVSVGGVLMLVELMPRRLQGFLSVFLELLAGIPSVVFGLWGVFTFGPFLSHSLYRWIADLHIPWLRGSTGSGQGLLTASLVLAVMVIPVIASTVRELFRAVPEATKEGALALGLTRREVVRVVTMPMVRGGIVGSSLLGLGRALGETIAVLLISGNLLNAYPHNIFDSFSSMAATIANFLDSALTDPTHMGLDTLAEVGLVLLAITLATNFSGRLIARRLAGDVALPVGRGV